MITKTLSLIFAAALVAGCASSSPKKRYEDLTSLEAAIFVDCFNRTRHDTTKKAWDDTLAFCGKRQGLDISSLPSYPGP